MSIKLKTATAEEFCTKVTDGTHDSPKQVEHGKLLVTSKNITSGRLDLEKSYSISIDDFNEVNKRSKVDVNDILLSMIGTVGEACLITEEPDFAIKNVGLLKNEDPVKAKWLYLYLSSPTTKHLIHERTRGTTQQYLPLGEIRKFPIIFPDDSKYMKKVTELMYCFIDKIELNRKMNETLEEMARAIFKSWFVDFDPVHAKARGEKPAGMPDEIADLFPSEFVHSDELGKPIPKGWEVVPLKNLIDFNPSRQLRSGSIASYVEMSSLPERGMSIKDFYKREFKSGTKFINGDTLFARITPCLENGKTAYVDCLLDGEVAWGSTEFIVMRSKADIGNYFSYLVARSDWFRAVAIASMTGSSGRQRASKEALEELLIAAPCLDVFKAFNRVIEKIPEKIKTAHNENQTLAELRDSLLPKLIRGEIEV